MWPDNKEDNMCGSKRSGEAKPSGAVHQYKREKTKQVKATEGEDSHESIKTLKLAIDFLSFTRNQTADGKRFEM